MEQLKLQVCPRFQQIQNENKSIYEHLPAYENELDLSIRKKTTLFLPMNQAFNDCEVPNDINQTHGISSQIASSKYNEFPKYIIRKEENVIFISEPKSVGLNANTGPNLEFSLHDFDVNGLKHLTHTKIEHNPASWVQRLPPSIRRTLLLKEVFDQTSSKRGNFRDCDSYDFQKIYDYKSDNYSDCSSYSVLSDSTQDLLDYWSDSSDSSCFFSTKNLDDTQYKSLNNSYDSGYDGFKEVSKHNSSFNRQHVDSDSVVESYSSDPDMPESDFDPMDFGTETSMKSSTNYDIVYASLDEPYVIQIFIKPELDDALPQNIKKSEFDSECYAKEVNKIEDYERCIVLPSYHVESFFTFVSPGFIDSHCHLDLCLEKKNFRGSYAEFRRKYDSEFPPSYGGCIAVFCYPDTFSQSEMWGKHLFGRNVWASFGCHPKRAALYNDLVEKALLYALKHYKVRALGEIGLDYSARSHCPIEKQQLVFKQQLKIAVFKKLPLVIHCRDAYEDCLQILKQHVPPNHNIHLHCFKASWACALQYLESFPNLCIGITNFVTYPDACLSHEVATKIPLDRLLLETDAPYFVPALLSESHSWSHPGMAIHVAAQVAALRGMPLKQILHQTHQNTKRVYNL